MRKTNKLLDKKPKIANFIPVEMGFPLFICGMVGFLSFQAGLPLFWAIALSLWVGSSYWLLIGNKPWVYLTKLLRRVPTWGIARAKYQLQHKNIKVITKYQVNG